MSAGEGAAASRRFPAPGQLYEPFDPGYARAAVEQVMAAPVDHWFRARLVGTENLPADGPCILAANHSGNALPYDAMVLDAHLWRHHGYDPAAKARAVFEKELTLAWWMRPYGIDDFWRRGGGVDMTFDNFDRLLTRGDTVLYFPEGVPGIGKGFNHRYELQRFSSSFVTLAARHRAPVCPLYIVNAEWLVPFGYTFKSLDRLLEKLFHVPFLPFPYGPVAALWPWVWYLAFPAQLTFVIGKPIDMRARTDAAGITDLQTPDLAAVRRVAAEVRDEMQAELTRLVAEYGQRPWDFRGLWASLKEAKRRGVLGRTIPTGWPAAWSVFQRNFGRPPARNRLHAILRDWDLIGFYLPFVGWPLLQVTRRLRKPPCGYRGLPAEERGIRQGEFVWRLSERPLPPRPPRA